MTPPFFCFCLYQVVEVSQVDFSALLSLFNRIDNIVMTLLGKRVLQNDNTCQNVCSAYEESEDVAIREWRSGCRRYQKSQNQCADRTAGLLHECDCTEDDARQAWYGFFNHDFWNSASQSANTTLAHSGDGCVCRYRETEQFVDELFDYDPRYKIHVDCTVSGQGFRTAPLRSCLAHLRLLPHHFTITCKVDTSLTTVPGFYEVHWKVKNVGPEAERRDCLRGQIQNRGFQITENTLFHGMHYIECYAVKGGVCVAKARIDVPIGRR